MDVTIRAATARDYDALCVLFAEVDAFHRERLPHLFQKPNGPAREYDYFRGLITDENVGLFVAECSEELVGLVHAVITDTPAVAIFVPRRYAIVDLIGVKSAYRQHGIGRRLMDAVHGWAIGAGATSIELYVYEFNEAAIAFYESLGYETLSRKMNKDLSN